MRLPSHRSSMLRRLTFAALLMSIAFAALARQPEPRLPPSPIAQQLLIEVVHGPNLPPLEVSPVPLAIWMQFGLVGSMVGQAIHDGDVNNAEAKIAPLRDMLADYDFYGRLEQALHARVASEGISPHPQFDSRNSSWQDAGVAEPEALILVPAFSMSPDLGELNVTMLAQWIKRVRGRSELDVLLTRKYAYSFPMAMGKPAERSASWAALGRERLHGLMDEAAGQLVDMLVYDFSSEGRARWQAKIEKGAFARVNDVGFGGREIRRGPGWVWVQVQIGKEWPVLRGHHPVVNARDGQ